MALSVLHFARAGIALFATDIETVRFAFASSGLLGFPSRAVLFGVPLLALVTGILRSQLPTSLVAYAWSVFVASRLLLGFKGGLIEVLVLALVVAAVERRRLGARMASAVAAVVLAAVTFGVVVGNSYGTIARGGGADASYFVDRMSLTAATPAWYLLELRDHGVKHNAFKDDSLYFVQRYTGLEAGGPDFPVDQIVSSTLTGTPRTGSAFIVPVTVGGPAYLYASGGAIIAGPGLALLGTLLGAATRIMRSAVQLSLLLPSAAAIFAVRTYTLNGSGAYLLFNLGATIVLMLGMYALGRLIFVDRRIGSTTAAQSTPRQHALLERPMRGYM